MSFAYAGRFFSLLERAHFEALPPSPARRPYLTCFNFSLASICHQLIYLEQSSLSLSYGAARMLSLPSPSPPSLPRDAPHAGTAALRTQQGPRGPIPQHRCQHLGHYIHGFPG